MHLRVVPGVQREQHPDPAVSVVVENEQVAVDVRVHLEPNRLALPIDAIPVHPEANRCSRGFRGLGSRKIRPRCAKER